MSPRLVATLVVPIYCLQPLLDALLQATGTDNLRESFPSLAQGFGEQQFLALLDPVLALELYHIPTHPVGDLGHQRLDAKEALHCAVATKCSRRGLVGVDHVASEFRVGRVVKRQPLLPAHHLHRQAVSAVGARITNEIELGGDHLHLVSDADLVAHDLGVAATGTGEFLLAGVFHAYRPASGEGQVGAEVLEDHLLLIAKAATDAGFNHADLFDRQA